jgi:hypothetical protein
LQPGPHCVAWSPMSPLYALSIVRVKMISERFSHAGFQIATCGWSVLLISCLAIRLR